MWLNSMKVKILNKLIKKFFDIEFFPEFDVGPENGKTIDTQNNVYASVTMKIYSFFYLK